MNRNSVASFHISTYSTLLNTNQIKKEIGRKSTGTYREDLEIGYSQGAWAKIALLPTHVQSVGFPQQTTSYTALPLQF